MDRWDRNRNGPTPPRRASACAARVRVEHTLARLGAERLWQLLNDEPYVAALGAMTGGQAVQMVKAGLQAIYLSGWQVAADANLAGQTYPDQSLYPSNSVPALVRRLNKALMRADQIEYAEGNGTGRHWLVPIVADAEAGFGGPLNAFELMRAMIEAGAAGVHFEDQLASEKKCGHLGGKVLVPTRQFVRTLAAARLAADVLRRADGDRGAHRRAQRHAAHERRRRARPRVPHRASARPRASSASRAAIESAIARGLAYAPYADLIWCETSTPDLDEARRVRRRDPRALPRQAARVQLLAVVQLEAAPRRRERSRRFQDELGEMGYAFQFITLAGFHALNRRCSSSPAAIAPAG